MLVSSGARERFEGLIEGEEEFSHHGGEGQFVRFAFGPQTLIKARQDRVEASGRECGHVEAATQSGPSAKDGAFAAHRSTVVVKWRQPGERGSLATIELAKLGHLREQERCCAYTDSADRGEFLCFDAERLVLRD